MRLAVNERYSSRQLERQMDSGYYERYMLSKSKLLPDKDVLRKKLQELASLPEIEEHADNGDI